MVDVWLQIQFEALPSRTILTGIPNSDMAIDDVTFVNCNANAVDANTSMGILTFIEQGF